MTDLADLVSVFGGIDDAVAGGAEHGDKAQVPSPVVAGLLPAYGLGAAGWFSRLKGATSMHGLAESGIKTLPAALESLAEESEGREGEPDHLTVRRILAVTVVSRVRAESGPESLPSAVTDDLLASALVPVVVQGSGGSAQTRASDLLALLRDAHKLYPDVASWQPMMHDAFRNGLVSAEVAGQLMVPATWGVVAAPGGGPAVRFETQFRVSGVTIDQAAGILDPSTWTSCTPPWCAMSGNSLPAAGTSIYLETVAIYCNLVGSLLTFTTPLHCRRSDLPGGQKGGVLEYRLGDDTVPARGDGKVTVDEGSVVVTEKNGQIDILSTKRVQFGSLSWMSSLEAAELAQLVWTFGYSSLAEFTVNRIIGAGGRGQLIGGTGPGTLAAGSSQSSGTGNVGSSGQDVLQAIEDALLECMTATRTSWSKIAMGAYGPDEYTADVLTATRHVVRHGSNVLRAVSQLGPDRTAAS